MIYSNIVRVFTIADVKEDGYDCFIVNNHLNVFHVSITIQGFWLILEMHTTKRAVLEAMYYRCLTWMS